MDTFLLRSNRSLELQGEQTEKMKATFLAARFSGETVTFHFRSEKKMRPKIERIDGWKDWVRNSALQMSTFACRKFEAW